MLASFAAPENSKGAFVVWKLICGVRLKSPEPNVNFIAGCCCCCGCNRLGLLADWKMLAGEGPLPKSELVDDGVFSKKLGTDVVVAGVVVVVVVVGGV